MTNLTKTEEHFCGVIETSEYDTFEIVRSGYNGHIRVIPFADRWRTPEETVMYLQGICVEIEKSFVEVGK